MSYLERLGGGTRILIALCVVLFAAGAAHVACTYAALPDRIATHFDLHGAPDGWSLKARFAPFFGGLILVMDAILIGLIWLVGATARFDRLMSLPNKDYWLATPERRNAAVGKLRVILLTLIAFLHVVFLLAWHMIYQANVARPFLHVSMEATGQAMLGGTLAYAGGLIVASLAMFRPPDDSPTPGIPKLTGEQ